MLFNVIATCALDGAVVAQKPRLSCAVTLLSISARPLQKFGQTNLLFERNYTRTLGQQ